MKKLMRLVLVVIGLLVSVSCFSQSGYSIHLKVDGIKDTTAYLGHYFWESTYIKDTAQVDSKGEFRFSSKEALPQGVYFLVLNRTRIFDFVVGEDQNFVLETNIKDPIKGMRVKDDVDNKIYFENMVFLAERHVEADPFVKVLRDSTLKEEQKKDARESFTKVNDRVQAFQQQIAAQYPKTMTGRMLKAAQQVKVPEPPKKPDGTIDSTFQLKWYREHFFDNFNLADEAMLRLPQAVYKEKVYEYLDKLFPPHPDSTFRAIQKFMDVSKKNQETFRYSIYLMIMKFQQPDIMGMDGVFVKLYDTYFATGQTDYWANAAMKKNMKEHADRLRKSLVGMKGNNLIMLDASLKPRSMYDIKNKYTILFIFDPECGHCRKETPKLTEFYDKNRLKFDIEVYAVCSDTSMSKMTKFTKEFKTKWITVNGPRTYVGSYHDHYDAQLLPSLYILDDKKKIIAKKIPIEKMEEFFTNYERLQKTQAAGNTKGPGSKK
jgi:thiol-disulfide isomerase/thioredoxin